MLYFVSDIHLGYYDRKKDKKIENEFINFLNTIEADCSTLILLGDIFDYWFEYKYTIPKYYYRTLAKLEQFIAKNINIIYIMGNHDFGHKTFFLEEIGIKIIETDLHIDLLGKKFFLSHGDIKLPKDYSYKILRKIFRNKICQFLFSTIHPTIGIKVAKYFSHSSKKHRSNNSLDTINNQDKLISVAQEIINNGSDFVIMGHTHIPSNIELTRPDGTLGRYINLGSWLKKPYYAKFDGTKIELIDISENFIFIKNKKNLEN